jgi:hypothetical protein
MSEFNEKATRARQTLWSSLFFLCFGLTILAFLTAIDRESWFHIRPVTGTAAAMANAAEKPPQL